MGCSGSKSPNDNAGPAGPDHIMISYNHTHQKLIIKIKDILKVKGFPVWIDVENMRGNMTDVMADAVENSHVVLLCMSKKYMNSDNCRMEAQHAKKKKKKIIPLLVERNFKPESWLDLIIEDKLWHDFTGNVPFKKQMQKLIEELNTHYEFKQDPSESLAEEEEDVYDDEAKQAYYDEYIAYDEGDENGENENNGEDNENIERDGEDNDENGSDCAAYNESDKDGE